MKNLNGLLAVMAMLLFASISYGQTFPIRINTGGPQFTDSNGNVYEADNSSYYTSGTSTSTRNVDGLVPPYNTIRYAPGYTMTYTIPVPNGNYDVKLHFAETWFGTTGGGTGGAGERKFDVNIEGGTLEIDNMDLYAIYNAAATPHVETFNNISVSDGGLTIYFTSQSSDGGIKHPLINAIEIDEVAASDNEAPTITSFTSNGKTDTFVDLSWDATDNEGVTSYKLFQDGTEISGINNSTSKTVTSLDPSTSYTFTLFAYDANNNESDLETLTVTTESSGSSSYDPDFILRLNAGGPAGTFDNKAFIADQYFSGGNPYTNTSTGLAEPYVTERYNSSGTLSYDIPAENGDYRVILHFAEIYYGATGGGSSNGSNRVFDVSIEGQLKLDNYNIFQEVGAETATYETFDITVAGGELNIYMSSQSAVGGNGHPKISAIEVLGTNHYTPDPPTGSGVWTLNETTNNIHYTSGNVGVGTSTPDDLLTVKGRIHAKEVKVDLQGALAPDYVFLKDYDLKTLEEVEESIKQNGHLPKIPSAKEMEEKGFELKMMNLRLLEKIEELTLYLIQQNKNQKQLEERIELLETTNK